MKIGVLGTGMVGEALASKFVSLGHEVKMGARDAQNPKAQAWAKKAGGKASHGTFADAARFGEMIFACTRGDIALDAIRMAGPENFAGKTLVDVANPLDFSHGMPPRLTVCNTDSLGEQIQRAFPKARVVKTLNTTNAMVMVDPMRVAGGDHDLFVSGNDAAAKARVTELLKQWFGWRSVIDLGEITTARGAEMILPIWVRLMGALGTPMFNFKISR